MSVGVSIGWLSDRCLIVIRLVLEMGNGSCNVPQTVPSSRYPAWCHDSAFGALSLFLISSISSALGTSACRMRQRQPLYNVYCVHANGNYQFLISHR